MRFLTTLLAISTMASAAMAQSAAIETIGMDGRGKPAAAAVAPAPAIGVFINQQAPHGIVGTPAYSYDPVTPKNEIGFDAKVKRDPSGKIIEDGKAAAVAAPKTQLQRNDSKLRGDGALFKPPAAPAAPAKPATITNADLMKQLKALEKNKE
ncbi:MAG: hypothetical protein V4735_03185 [Pseudomonadota bacterium]